MPDIVQTRVFFFSFFLKARFLSFFNFLSLILSGELIFFFLFLFFDA